MHKVFLAVLAAHLSWPHQGGEGWDLTMQVPESAASFTRPYSKHAEKLHGAQPPYRQTTSKILKRSLRRAQTRAQAHGFAWYRGQMYTPAQLGQPPLPQTKQPPQRPVVTSKPNHRYNKHRVNFFTWNCNGLSLSKQDELLHWLNFQPIGVACIQETHRHADHEWQDPEWTCIQVGTHVKSPAGLLTLVRKRLCPSTHISWHTYIAGRLTHVRLYMEGHHIDIVACYQFAYHTDLSVKQARKDFWQQLTTCLGNLPRRNTLAIL